MISGQSFESIRALLDHDHHAFKLLAQVVCSTYWRAGEINLNSLGELDRQNFSLALGIISYRRTPGWSEQEFYSLAAWCRDRHDLWEWMGLVPPETVQD